MFIKFEKDTLSEKGPNKTHLIECDTVSWSTLVVEDPTDYNYLVSVRDYGGIWCPFMSGFNTSDEHREHQGFPPRGVVYFLATRTDKGGNDISQEILLEGGIAWVMNDKGDTIQKITPPIPSV